MIATLRNMRLVQEAGLLDALMYSTTTGEKYSAHPGDYWASDLDDEMVDANGDPMLLFREVTLMEYIDLTKSITSTV